MKRLPKKSDAIDPETTIVEMHESGLTPDARKVLIDLSHAGRNGLDAQTVLDVARDHRSPLHNYFQWDDTLAAEQYRLSQARLLISRYRITVEGSDTPIKVRMFVSLTDSNGDRAYERIHDVMASDEMFERLVGDIESTIATLRVKLKHLLRVRPAVVKLQYKQLLTVLSPRINAITNMKIKKGKVHA